MKTKNLIKIDEEILLDAIINTSKSFLQNDISIEVIETFSTKNSNINKHYSLVGFNGDIDIFCVISIDEELLERIYNVFVPCEVSNEEKQEMIGNLPDEIVNTVAGLAIASFPKEYDNLVMSEPLSLDKNILEDYETTNMSVSKKIQTVYGSFVCTIIKMKD